MCMFHVCAYAYVGACTHCIYIKARDDHQVTPSIAFTLFIKMESLAKPDAH